MKNLRRNLKLKTICVLGSPGLLIYKAYFRFTTRSSETTAADRLAESFPVLQAYENFPAFPQAYAHLCNNKNYSPLVQQEQTFKLRVLRHNVY